MDINENKKKIAKDRKVIPELFVEIDKRIQERINFEKNKEIIERVAYGECMPDWWCFSSIF